MSAYFQTSLPVSTRLPFIQSSDNWITMSIERQITVNLLIDLLSVLQVRGDVKSRVQGVPPWFIIIP